MTTSHPARKTWSHTAMPADLLPVARPKTDAGPARAKPKSPATARQRESTRSTRVSPNELASFTSQMAIMTRSGVDVSTALGSLSKQCGRPALARLLKEVHENVLAGVSLSEALRRQERVFGATYVATVAAGEASGNMAHVLAQLSQVQQGELRMGRTIRALLTYPILLTAVSSLVVASLVLFVLPQFAAIFEQYEMPLPFITKAMLGCSQELRSHWWFWGPIAGGAMVAFMAIRATEQGKRWRDQFLLQAPLFRPVSQSLLAGRSYRLLGLMLESGVPLLECLRLSQRSVGNVLYKELFARMEEGVLNGKSLASGMESNDILPSSAVEMIATAERTGKLGEVACLVGEHFEEEGEAHLRQLVGMAEPIITLLMGCVVAVVVLAVMLPMFDLATLAHD